MTRSTARTLARYGLGDSDRVSEDLQTLGLGVNGLVVSGSEDVLAAWDPKIPGD